MPTLLSPQQIFISYSRRDDAIMQRIVAFLREQGFDVWVDNEQLTPGTPIWEYELEKAIKRATAIVVLSSPDSKKSEWVTRELVVAQRHRKRIFPLLIRGDEDSSLHFRLSTNQYIDLRENEVLGLKSLDVAILKYFDFLKKVEEEEKAKEKRRKKIVREEEERKSVESREKEKADALAKEVASEKIRKEKEAREKKEAEEKKRVEKREKARRAEILEREKRTAEEKERIEKKEQAEALTRKSATEKPSYQIKSDESPSPAFGRGARGEGKSSQPKPFLSQKTLLIGGGIIILFILGSIIKSALAPTTPTLTKTPATATLDFPAEMHATSIPDVVLPADAPPTDAQLGDTWLRLADDMIMSYIPAGEFQMGSEDGQDDEKPVHTVSLDAFWMDQTEVSNTQFQ